VLAEVKHFFKFCVAENLGSSICRGRNGAKTFGRIEDLKKSLCWLSDALLPALQGLDVDGKQVCKLGLAHALRARIGATFSAAMERPSGTRVVARVASHRAYSIPSTRPRLGRWASGALFAWMLIAFLVCFVL